jgi:hypothetical protein
MLVSERLSRDHKFSDEHTQSMRAILRKPVLKDTPSLTVPQSLWSLAPFTGTAVSPDVSLLTTLFSLTTERHIV